MEDKGTKVKQWGTVIRGSNNIQGMKGHDNLGTEK